MSHDTQVKQEAPERIWLQRFEDGEQEFSMLWYESDLRPLMSEPPEKQRPFHAIQYVRADLLATVRREEQANFVNNVAAILDANDVEAFTALIMKAKASPDLNSETRSALRSEAEIRREAFKEAVALVQSVTNENDLDDGGFFEAGFIAARTKSIDALIAASAPEKGEVNG